MPMSKRLLLPTVLKMGKKQNYAVLAITEVRYKKNFERSRQYTQPQQQTVNLCAISTREKTPQNNNLKFNLETLLR